ncbi:MAG: TRAP transporter substrate-binding protein [Rhodospirillaceae bacterium]
MWEKRSFARVVACASLAVLPLAANAQTELRLINGFDARQTASRLVVVELAERVKNASNGKLTIKINGPEVAKPAEQLQPTSRGLFDLMFTTQVYHSGTTSLGIAAYAMKPDPKGWRENGIMDIFDKDYQRFNLKLLALVFGEAADTGAYQVVLKKPIGPSGDLAGLKLRGTKTYEPFIKALGGTVVLLTGGEIYTALERGVIDGAAWPVNGAIDFKWYEIAKYMTRPTFGHSSYTLTMNMDKFKALSEADRNLLVEEAKKAEYWGMEAMDKQVQSDVAKMAGLGMIETKIDKAKFDETMAKYYGGLWEVAAEHKGSADAAKRLHELAKKSGHAL